MTYNLQLTKSNMNTNLTKNNKDDAGTTNLVFSIPIYI